jgi:ribose transport system permease protein
MSAMRQTGTFIAAARERMSPPLLALLLAVALFFFGGLINPNFVNPTQAVNILRQAALLGIIAAGQTLVIISGREGIDLSVGSVVTLSAIIIFRLTNGDNALILPALAVAMLAGTLIGALNGIGITLIGIPPLVMTLGMAGVVQGLILQVTQGQLIGANPPLMRDLIANPLIFGIAGVVFIWLLLGFGMWLLLERTEYGKQLFAVGVNRTTARLSGVRVVPVVIATYALSGMLGAFGGFIALAINGTVFLNLGNPYLFPSIAAVVVGGTVLAGGRGSYWGTMSGALVLQLINSLLTVSGLQEGYQLIVLGVILLVLISVYGRQRNLRQ